MSSTRALDGLAISPTGFVFDPRTGGTFSVNPAGRLLLEGIRDGLGLDALVSAIEAEFDTHAADLQRDVLEFARTLKAQGFVAPDFELS